ncbi:response regulator transcription factor [Streptomyces sp. F63]|uniref:helix-turn-helix transcriptional regulator n=1 Tax=Streptomyces sp. F63 TaxID=2824887 RepID=UPI001B39C107|nr:response regulator transcription factor [Streptomyces sp. F63]MBQ0983235.1 response regulator transcription factor [Streptomyces sp. F63]
MNFAGPSQIRRAIQGARQEVLLSLPGHEPARQEQLEQQVDTAAARSITGDSDVAVRMYVPSAVRGTDRLPEHTLATLAMEGLEIHSTSGRNPRMAIIDRSIVILACNQADYDDGALIGHGLPFTPILVRSLTSDLPEDDTVLPDAGALNPISREVLRQLTLGTKDEAAAREMGMALRTYRRTVARIMDSLDARSRFQAGYVAAQRNLL